MHTIWKGAISFGLVNIPVKMYAATEDKDISMRMLHKPCGTPISYARRCPTCESPVANEEIMKGYEYEKGRFVKFEKDELDALAADSSREIKIIDFVNLEEIDPIYFQKTYYLGPGDTGANAYGLLLQALQDTGKIGIASVTIRNKSSLAAIRIVDNCISMETIFYPDEIRPAQQVPNLHTTAVNVNEKELTMAKMLIEQLSVPFDPEKYHDEYRKQVMELIQKKIAGEEIEVAPQPQRNNVIDLMAALQASLEAAKDKSPDVKAATDKGATTKAKAGAAATEVDDGKPAAAKPKRTRKKAAGAEDESEAVGTPTGVKGNIAVGAGGAAVGTKAGATKKAKEPVASR